MHKNPFSSPAFGSRLFVISLLIIIASGLFFRLYPVTVNRYIKIRNLSHAVIFSNLQKVLSADISKEHPTLSPEEKKNILDREFRNTLKKDKKNIDAITKKIVLENKDIEILCLLGADSYYYYALTKRIIENGRYSDRFRSGKYFDPLMTAPNGCWRNIEIHPYIGYLFHNTLRFFYRNIPLYFSLSVIPLIYFVYSVLLFLIICQLLKISGPVTVISAAFFSLAPIFIQRSSFGWYDSDPYNIIFPLLLIFMLLKISMRENAVIWTVVLSFTSALYALFWQGWIFLTATAFLSLLSIALYQRIKNEPHMPMLRNAACYLLGTIAFLSVLITPSGLINSVKDMFSIFSEFLFIKIDPWPDIFLTVGELKTSSIAKTNALLGGSVFFPVALAGAVMMISGKGKTILRDQRIILIVVFGCSFLLAKSAERFAIFLLPSIACLFAVGADWIFLKLQRFLRDKNAFFSIPVMCLFSSMIILPFIDANNAALIQNPIYNKVWDNALKYTKANTPENSIIISWWPPGHFIRAVAERGVTFDGATLNVPQAYWLGRFWLSENETEAVGILRMLNSGGNNAVEYLTANGLSLDKAITLIDRIILLKKSDAVKVASEYLPIKKVSTLLDMTHPSSVVPSYCFLYDDMVESIVGLDYVKDWDFKKATEEFKKLRFKPFLALKKLKRGSKNNVEFIWSLAGGRKYIGERSPQKTVTDDTVTFKNGVVLDRKNMRAKIINLENKISGIPESLIYLDDKSRLVEKTFTDSTVKLSVLLINKPDPSGSPFYSVIVGQARTLRSIIFRLYYFNGAGLKHFKPFLEETDPRFKTKIVMYEVVY